MAPSLSKKIRIRMPILREIMAEFLGTFILVLLGNACVAQSVLSKSVKGDFFAINWGWGFGAMMGVIIAGGVSGAHLNPAVTLALASVKRFPFLKIFAYWAAQYLGALAAAASVLGVYSEALQHSTGGNLTVSDQDPGTAGIFATYPESYLSAEGGLGDQILGSMFLLLCICAITDKKNTHVPAPLVPLYIGFAIVAIGVCFGANCGYAVNPARDLAPRILTLLAGWGSGVFSFRNYNWFWVPIVGPHIGAILGVLVYIVFIEAHWPEGEQPTIFPLSIRHRKDDRHKEAIDMEKL